MAFPVFEEKINLVPRVILWKRGWGEIWHAETIPLSLLHVYISDNEEIKSYQHWSFFEGQCRQSCRVNNVKDRSGLLGGHFFLLFRSWRFHTFANSSHLSLPLLEVVNVIVKNSLIIHEKITAVSVVLYVTEKFHVNVQTLALISLGLNNLILKSTDLQRTHKTDRF